MIVSLIVAMDKQRVIGYQNKMPWHIPADLAHFKKITLGKPIVMGRKTFESIGRSLPGRRNVVISRQADLSLSGCEVVHSLSQAYALLKSESEIMIIGGSEIFQQALPDAKRLYLTIINHTFVGDTYFPEFDFNDWVEITREDHPADSKNSFSYQFITLEKTKTFFYKNPQGLY